MHDNLAVAAATVARNLTLSSAGTALSAASISNQVATSNAAVTMTAQLNVTHSFMYLQVPLWYFFAASVVLAFVGAFWSLTTDTIKNKGSTASKILTATTVGLIATFVVLPAVSDTPNVIVMMLTSLGGGFSGTVLLYLAARLVNNKDLHDAVIDLAIDKIVSVLKFFGKIFPSNRSNGDK